MHFLLTNDDGYDAQGLDALWTAAEPLGKVTVVAPATNWSVCAHRITTDKPLRGSAHRDRGWIVDGTPADCVRLGLIKFAADFQWALSGMNHGANLGADVYHSGTVAAIREAALHGRPGIAISHYRKKNRAIDWPRAIEWMRRIILELTPRPIEPGQFWNVNLPHLRDDEPEPRLVICPLDRSPLPISFREDEGAFHYDGDYHGRPRVAGADVDVCFGGDISATLLQLG